MTDLDILPKHIGIIMDGNGRWAQSQGFSRSKGHREGLKSAKAIVKEVSRLGIPYLSLYVFSTENWKRTEDEVSYLMSLLRNYLKKEYQFYLENQIKVVHSGNLEALPGDIQKDIHEISKETRHFTGTTVNLLINYGGQNEIIRAIQSFSKNHSINELTQEKLYTYLDQPECPPIDLVIRTAGEVRLSNFMLWQAAYAEYYFTDTLWPDFDEKSLNEALLSYQKRTRKFGGYSK